MWFGKGTECTDSLAVARLMVWRSCLILCMSMVVLGGEGKGKVFITALIYEIH